MNISYRVRSLASAEQPTSWANRSAVASGDWLARSAAVPPALRRVLGRINTGNVSSPRWLVSARSAATTALQRAALFPSVGVVPAGPDAMDRTIRASGSHPARAAIRRPSGQRAWTFPPSTPPAVGPCQHSIGPAGAF